jgi:hypothetical protein
MKEFQTIEQMSNWINMIQWNRYSGIRIQFINWDSLTVHF